MKTSIDQRLINELCCGLYESALRERAEMPWVSDTTQSSWQRLRHCFATVLETPNFWILRSYQTVVAVIDKASGKCHDVLRMVYGYDATSAQHISKFNHDFGCGVCYTWRKIPRQLSGPTNGAVSGNNKFTTKGE